MHLFFEDPDRQDKADDRRDRQLTQINEVNPSAQEGDAGPVEEASRGDGSNIREDIVGVGGKGEKKAGQKDEGHDYHGFDPAQVFRLIDQGAAERAEAGEGDTPEKNKEEVTPEEKKVELETSEEE